MSTRPFGPDGADDTLVIACGAVVSDRPVLLLVVRLGRLV
jgi:hypothetical protein